MRAFEYASPASLDQAIRLLGNSWDDAAPLAGGTDLICLLKDDIVAPKRLGATMSSFNRQIRSVPPASGAASSQELPRRRIAWSRLAGLAYSNARIAASFLFQSRQHSLRCQWQTRHAHADRVGYGIRNGRAR